MDRDTWHNLRYDPQAALDMLWVVVGPALTKLEGADGGWKDTRLIEPTRVFGALCEHPEGLSEFELHELTNIPHTSLWPILTELRKSFSLTRLSGERRVNPHTNRKQYVHCLNRR